MRRSPVERSHLARSWDGGLRVDTVIRIKSASDAVSSACPRLEHGHRRDESSPSDQKRPLDPLALSAVVGA